MCLACTAMDQVERRLLPASTEWFWAELELVSLADRRDERLATPRFLVDQYGYLIDAAVAAARELASSECVVLTAETVTDAMRRRGLAAALGASLDGAAPQPQTVACVAAITDAVRGEPLAALVALWVVARHSDDLVPAETDHRLGDAACATLAVGIDRALLTGDDPYPMLVAARAVDRAVRELLAQLAAGTSSSIPSAPMETLR